MEIDLNEAQDRLYELGEMAWNGQEIVITNKGKPYLKLVAHPDGEPIQKRTGLGRLDQIKGDAWIASDLPETTEDIIEAFDGPLLNEGDGTRGIGSDVNQTWVAPDLPETSEEIIEAFEGKWSNDFF